MSRIAYVNGYYVPHRFATTHIEDRGYQFADGVYEVIALMNGKLIDLEPHLDRLDYSLAELKIERPVSREVLVHILKTTLQRNRLLSGMVYIQITRGVAPRYHGFPKAAEPTLVITCSYVNFEKIEGEKKKGIKVISLPDIRWRRPDIKSISLLPNVLGKQQALEQGAYEAILINREGYITESNSTNFWIIPKAGILQTFPISQQILNGITRRRVSQLAVKEGWEIVEKPFTLEQAKQAEEAFLSSSISGIMPVIAIDNQLIGTGKPGMIVSKLIDLYKEFAQ